jgi:hypothetical protein
VGRLTPGPNHTGVVEAIFVLGYLTMKFIIRNPKFNVDPETMQIEYSAHEIIIECDDKQLTKRAGHFCKMLSSLADKFLVIWHASNDKKSA